MSALVDARPHITAIKAAIAAEIGTSHVYSYGQVPGADGNAGTLPDLFVLVAVERRQATVLRSARAGDAGWRVLTTALGRTVNECAWVAAKVAAALNEQRLEVAGSWTTPIQFESEAAPNLDDGRYAADAFYTYVR